MGRLLSGSPGDLRTTTSCSRLRRRPADDRERRVAVRGRRQRERLPLERERGPRGRSPSTASTGRWSVRRRGAVGRIPPPAPVVSPPHLGRRPREGLERGCRRSATRTTYPARIKISPGGGLVARRPGVLRILAVTASTTPPTAPAIEVDALAKAYGEVDAVRGVSFTVARGEVFGFLGPNGAGKSTTINMLCTLARPTSGTARVGGFDVVARRDDVRRHIGLVFQDPTLDGYLTAEQNLRLHAQLYGIDPAVVPARMRQMLEMVGLWDRRKASVRTYSGGMRRRLEIAAA